MKGIFSRILAIAFFCASIFFTAILLNAKQKSNSTELGFLNEGYIVNNILPMIYNGICMLSGIFFGFFYTRLTELQKQKIETVDIKYELTGIFKNTSFYLALAASPIVFGVLILTSKGMSLGPSLFLAFQNGFFWQNVMPKTITTSPRTGG